MLIGPAKSEYSMFRWFAVYASLEAAVEGYVGLLVECAITLRGWLIKMTETRTSSSKPSVRLAMRRG